LEENGTVEFMVMESNTPRGQRLILSI